VQAVIEGYFRFGSEPAPDALRAEKLSALPENSSPAVKKGANPGIGGPDQGSGLLHCPDGGLGQMLPGRGTFSEPAVVADVQDNARALPDLFLGRVGKDYFIAD
jgi:hypothetical protein